MSAYCKCTVCWRHGQAQSLWSALLQPASDMIDNIDRAWAWRHGRWPVVRRSTAPADVPWLSRWLMAVTSSRPCHLPRSRCCCCCWCCSSRVHRCSSYGFVRQDISRDVFRCLCFNTLHYVAKYCKEYVCLSLCMSTRISEKPCGQTLSNLLYSLPVAVARYSFDGFAICYVIPECGWRHVLYHGTNVRESSMTLCLEEFARWRYQLLVKTTTSVWLSSSECGNGGEVCYLRLTCWFCTFPNAEYLYALNRAVDWTLATNRCEYLTVLSLHFAPENPEVGKMYLLVPAHPGCPGQIPEEQ